MLEIVIVCLIVGVVLFLAARSFYRTLTGKQDGCSGCGTKSCPASEQCDAAGTEKSETTEP